MAIEFKSRKISEDERGATMLEYALIAACIAVVSIGTIGFVGEEAYKTFDVVENTMEGAMGGTNLPPGQPPI